MVTFDTLCTVILTPRAQSQTTTEKPQSIKASDFKARCLALLDEVAEGHAEFVVTKHGREVARVVPISSAPSTFGSVTLVAEGEESYFGIGETWDVEN